MIELRQSWPLPDHPLPIVIFGAGSIVTDAHIPAYTASGFVIQGIYDPDLEKAQAEEEWLRDAVEQLDLLAPQHGEEDELSAERERLANVGRIGESLATADEAAFGDAGAQSMLGRARAALEKAAPLSGGLLDEAQAALERADAELAEASAAISGAGHALDWRANK